MSKFELHLLTYFSFYHFYFVIGFKKLALMGLRFCCNSGRWWLQLEELRLAVKTHLQKMFQNLDMPQITN